MPVQRTFTLIQAAPGAGSPAQPMTSKQVRKAYKAATRAAPMSRAERQRQERADQDRIRRELDRDRAAARARAARERKRERAVGERAQRRRAGLPLADVRPSQDTIAAFVRGNGSGRKRSVAGLCGGGAEADVDDDDKQAGQRGELRAVAQGSGEIDLIPEEDDLGLEALEQLDKAVAAAVSRQSHEPGAARRESSSSPAASPRSCRNQPRSATPHELDLGLRDHKREKTPPPPPSRQSKPPKPVPPASSPGSPPRPAGTQAILCNLDEYFPSSSQQERELRAEMAAVGARPHRPEPPSSPPAASPRRFFTALGDRELVTLALKRSRCSAALEEMRKRERRAPFREAANRACEPSSPDAVKHRGAWSGAAKSPSGPDKENAAPQSGGGNDPPASQETEYGGKWIDEIAAEFTIDDRHTMC